MNNSVESLKNDLKKLADSKQATLLQRFFKTGPGEYGEGDVFLGIKVPVQRKVAKNYNELSLDDIQELLKSKIHEFRFIALVILSSKYRKANSEGKKEIFKFYLKNTENINNWDLVDVTCPRIVGDYLLDKPASAKLSTSRKILYKLASSKNLWERRIAIVSTGHFIYHDDFIDTLAISEILLNDKHDLIHKAVGWMLREVGKRDQKVLEIFLDKHYKKMPRVMLRYAIEKLPEGKRKGYLKK